MIILQRNIMTADQQGARLMKKGMFDTTTSLLLQPPPPPQAATGGIGGKVGGGEKKKKKNIQELVRSSNLISGSSPKKNPLLQSPSSSPPFPFPFPFPPTATAAAAATSNRAAAAAATAATTADLYVDASNNVVPFPLRLHAMLDDAVDLGFDHIVSWECDGHAFKVHNIDEFTNQILSHYFINQTRYKSFQRQLNMYGFQRISRGRSKGTCFHKFFVQGQSQLCFGMQRIKVRDTTSSSSTVTNPVTVTTGGDPQQVLSSSSATKSPPLLTSSDSTTEPASSHDNDVAAVDSSSSSSSTTSASLSSSDDSSKGGGQEEEEGGGGTTTTFDIAFFEGKSFFLVEEKTTLKQDQQQEEEEQQLQQQVIFDNLPPNNDILHKKKKDPSSMIMMEQQVIESSRSIVRPQKNCRNDSFPWKLYDLLEFASQNGHEDIISWEDDGKAMKVHNPKELCTQILPQFFLHTKKWESFQRQLNLYGFTRIARNPHKGRYVHPNFRRGQRSLCRHITRPR